MKFMLAQERHLHDLCRITNEAKAHLKNLGLNQWQKGYPNRDVWQEDILRQSAWLAMEGETPLGAFMFQTTPDPSYAVIDGAWLTTGAYATLHRVCVSDRCRGQGIAGAMFRQGMLLARDQHLPALRVDTHSDNRPMRRALEKAGFTLCGVITLQDGAEIGQSRIAYEMVLTE